MFNLLPAQTKKLFHKGTKPSQVFSSSFKKNVFHCYSFVILDYMNFLLWALWDFKQTKKWKVIARSWQKRIIVYVKPCLITSHSLLLRVKCLKEHSHLFNNIFQIFYLWPHFTETISSVRVFERLSLINIYFSCLNICLQQILWLIYRKIFLTHQRPNVKGENIWPYCNSHSLNMLFSRFQHLKN